MRETKRAAAQYLHAIPLHASYHEFVVCEALKWRAFVMLIPSFEALRCALRDFGAADELICVCARELKLGASGHLLRVLANSFKRGNTRDKRHQTVEL